MVSSVEIEYHNIEQQCFLSFKRRIVKWPFRLHQ